MIVGNPIPNTKMKVYIQRHDKQNFVTFSDSDRGITPAKDYTFRVPDHTTLARIFYIADLFTQAYDEEVIQGIIDYMTPVNWKFIG